MPFDEAAAAGHVREAVLATPVALEPFAHLLIADLYPDDVFDGIMTMWPDLELFQRSNSLTRYEFNFDVGHKKLPKEHLEFWRKVTRVTNIANLTIQQRLSSRFGEKFAIYVGRDWQSIVGANVDCLPTSIQLATYTNNFGLAPHVDALRLLTNAFVYFSDKDASIVEPELGTVLYKSKGMAIPTNWPLERQATAPYLDKAVVSAYQRNHCLAYINSPVSFHGVDDYDIGDRHRRLLMFGSMIYVRELQRILGKEMAEFALAGVRPAPIRGL
ncbi:MAG: hypothetical protein OSB69_15870 [Alphaproteobacteria bacterium]|nr:hypothetical protein [Alphaproteobacteria bacterium]